VYVMQQTCACVRKSNPHNNHCKVCRQHHAWHEWTFVNLTAFYAFTCMALDTDMKSSTVKRSKGMLVVGPCQSYCPATSRTCCRSIPLTSTGLLVTCKAAASWDSSKTGCTARRSRPSAMMSSTATCQHSTLSDQQDSTLGIVSVLAMLPETGGCVMETPTYGPLPIREHAFPIQGAASSVACSCRLCSNH